MSNTSTSSGSSSSTTVVSPMQPLLWFVIITIIYIYFLFTSKKNLGGAGGNEMVYFAIYILLVIAGEFFLNVNITKSICGSSQWYTAFMVTIFPWVFIFGILVVLLKMFPSWLQPFSNTIGYAITLASGLTSVFKNIIPPEDKRQGNVDSGISRSLEYIYSNSGLLINLITPSNFNNFYNRMKNDGLIIGDPVDLKEKLYSMVVLKETVSLAVWYLLAGILITSVSYNSIVNAGCQVSASEMQSRHDEYEKGMQNVQSATDSSSRVYSTNE